MDKLESSLKKLEEIAPIFNDDLADEKIANNLGLKFIHVNLLHEFIDRKHKKKLALSDGNHEFIELIHKKLKEEKKI